MIIPREVNNRTTKKRIVELCTNDINDINRCKIKPGESGQKKKKSRSDLEKSIKDEKVGTGL